MSMVEVTELTKVFSSLRAVDSINFGVHREEHANILGQPL